MSGTLLLALLAVSARASDAPAATDAIADAKKDLAAIKAPISQPDAAGSLQAADPRDDGPEAGGTRPDAPALATPDRESLLGQGARREGTGNWLVDAMDGKPEGSQPARAREGDFFPKGDSDLLRVGDKLAPGGERDARSLDEAREKSGPREAVGPAFNPLDAFMSGWISAKDHDLLLPASGGGQPAVLDGGRAHPDLLPGLDPFQAGLVAESALGPLDTSGLADGGASANPYLPAMDMAALPPTRAFAFPDFLGLAPAGGADASHGMPASGVDPRTLDSFRSLSDDLAQPADDDKYFKQLKRF